jgi:hypothetical protein
MDDDAPCVSHTLWMCMERKKAATPLSRSLIEIIAQMDELDIDPRLVNEDGDFTPAFEAVLIQMFKRFDVDQDGVWSLTELQEFAKATNGAPVRPPCATNTGVV